MVIHKVCAWDGRSRASCASIADVPELGDGLGSDPPGSAVDGVLERRATGELDPRTLREDDDRSGASGLGRSQVEQQSEGFADLTQVHLGHPADPLADAGPGERLMCWHCAAETA